MTDCTCPRCRIAKIMGVEVGGAGDREQLLSLLLGNSWITAQVAADAGTPATPPTDAQILAVFQMSLDMLEFLNSTGQKL